MIILGDIYLVIVKSINELVMQDWWGTSEEYVHLYVHCPVNFSLDRAHTVSSQLLRYRINLVHMHIFVFCEDRVWFQID